MLRSKMWLTQPDDGDDAKDDEKVAATVQHGCLLLIPVFELFLTSETLHMLYEQDAVATNMRLVRRHDPLLLATFCVSDPSILSSFFPALTERGNTLQLHEYRSKYHSRKPVEIPGCKWWSTGSKTTHNRSSEWMSDNQDLTSETPIPSHLRFINATPEHSSTTCWTHRTVRNIIYLLPLMLTTALYLMGGVTHQLVVSVALPILIASWTRGTILVLYLGVSSVSAHPIQPIGSVSITNRQTSTVWTVPLKGWPNTGYCASMRFGINKQQIFCMIVDTGSANTAIAATPTAALGGLEFFDTDRTGQDFVNMSQSVGVTYSSGEWSGYLVRDKLGLGDFSMVEGVFSLITSSDEFFIERADWAGILGLAYTSLAKPEPGVGTVWDSVREANSLQDVFTMQLCPPRESTLFPGTFLKQGGYMTLGGINTSLYQTDRPIHYTKIVEERFFNILLTDISVGGKKLNISCKEFNTDKTIVDSGTTDIYFPEKVFEAIKDCFTEYFKGGLPMVVPEEFWIGERKLLWQAAHVEEIYECFPTIHLSMADHQNSSQQFTLDIVPQLYLRQIDVLVGESDPAMCPSTSPCDGFTFGVKPRAQGTVIGANAMVGYYTVFDRENKRVGFAESTCDYRNYKATPSISGPHPRAPVDCEMPPLATQWATITYICGAITMTLATTMTAIVVFVQVRRCSRKRCITLPKRIVNKVQKAHRLAVRTIVCCRKFDDEGYVSETTPPSPSEVSAATFISSLSSNENDQIIVSSTQPVVAPESSGTEMVAVLQPANQESTKIGTAHGATDEQEQPRRKPGSNRRKRRQNYPVMESETSGGRDALCVDSSRKSRPLPAVELSRDLYSSSAIVTERALYQEKYNSIVFV